MLEKSQHKNGLLPVNSHTEVLPFPNNFFDRIIMIDALHHVCNQQKTANELFRVLKSGGRIVIEEPNINFWGVKLVALAEKISMMRSHFLKPEAISSLFLQGVTNIIHEDYNSWIIIDK